jgi:hypothetical protein
MERGRGWTRCVLWGGVALGVGTVLFALCSPSSVGCTTNLVVLTHSQVTARGCAAYSVAAHLGVGLMVLGGILLFGSFVLVVRQRRQAAAPAPTAEEAPPVGAPRGATAPAPATAPVPTTAPATAAGPSAASVGEPAPAPEVLPEPAPTRPGPAPPAAPSRGEPPFVERRRRDRRAPLRVGPIPPGEDDLGPIGPESLPPGWYGNPDNPGGPVQWWDGERLVDRPR